MNNPCLVRLQRESRGLNDFLGLAQGMSQRVRCSIVVLEAALGALLVEKVADVPVEPVTVEFGPHGFGAGDGSTAERGGAEAFEGLCHVPFCRWVEEGEFITGVETFRSNKDIEISRVKDLPLHISYLT